MKEKTTLSGNVKSYSLFILRHRFYAIQHIVVLKKIYIAILG